MPFLHLSFRVQGFEVARVGFGQTQALLGDWRPAFRQMHQAWERYQERVFATEGVHRGARWAPLSPRYAAWKAVRFPRAPILTLTGALRQAAKGLVVLEPHRAAMGPGQSVPYAIFHERGTRRMPARPFLAPSRAFLIELREIARAHLMAVRQAARGFWGNP